MTQEAAARDDFLSKVTRGALIPQHLIPYLEAVSEFTPEVYGSCLVYFSEEKPKTPAKKSYSSAAVKYSSTFDAEEEEAAPAGTNAYVIGYPINPSQEDKTAELPEGYDQITQEELTEAIEMTLRRQDLSRITVISPVHPEAAPGWALCQNAAFWQIPIEPLKAPVSKKLGFVKHMLSKENVTQEKWGQDHEILVSKYMANAKIPADGAPVYTRIKEYLKSCPDAALFSLRGAYSRLEAFAVADFSSCHTAFYMFSLIAGRPSPSTVQYLMTAIAQEAGQRGYSRMNVGLGNEQSMSFLQGHWKAKPFLTYTETSWNPHGLTKADEELLKPAPKGQPQKNIYMRSEAGIEKKPDWKDMLKSLFWPIKRK